jgi:transglutaminase-like putative cysteine protease
MNLRLTLTAAVAVLLTSVALYPLIQGDVWFWAGVGAVIVAAGAGVVTRLQPRRAAVTGSVLALIAVIPMLAGQSWLLRVGGVVIVAITAARWLDQRRLLQALGCLITYLAALLIYLNLAFASSWSVAGLVPTGTSVSHLWSLAGQGLDARSQTPPVPGGMGVVLLAAGGVGLIAAATDLLAVRLRSPGAAGLPLLAIYVVPITTSARRTGIGAALVFCLCMIGFLALLAVEGRERLRAWGRVVSVWDTPGSEPADGVDTRGLAASGRRIGLAAACFALIIPLVVPGVSLHDLLQSHSTNVGPGVQPGGLITLPNPLVQMRDQLTASSQQTVLTYHTTAADPPEQYLQVYVLNYDAAAGAWTLVPPGSAETPVGSKALRPDPGLAPSTPAAHPTTDVTFSSSVTGGYGSRLAFLAMPYAPATIRVSDGTWQEDNATLMVWTGGTSLAGLNYTVTSTEATPGSSQLDQTPSYPPSVANYRSFAAGPGGDLAKLADQIIAGAKTPYQKALKLQSYFTSGAFTYNVDVNLPNSIAGLTKFLFTTKTGMCQQFAFAMAALARLVGIPSRIAVGYTAGSPAGKGTWKVTTGDAHAWPELYFAGVGWLRFEPTPGGAAGQGTATAPQYAATSASGSGPLPPGVSPATAPGLFAGRFPDEGELRAGSGGSGRLTIPAKHDNGSVIGWILLALAIAVVALLVTPVTVRTSVRRRRVRTVGDAALADAAWRELRDNMADYGLACRASESPRAAARRIVAAVRLEPDARQAVGRIVSAEERRRYARAPLGSGTLAADTAAVRLALSRDAGWRTRWRALLLPRSTLGPIGQALHYALDVFGWMDTVGLRFRGAAHQQQG